MNNFVLVRNCPTEGNKKDAAGSARAGRDSHPPSIIYKLAPASSSPDSCTSLLNAVHSQTQCLLAMARVLTSLCRPSRKLRSSPGRTTTSLAGPFQAFSACCQCSGGRGDRGLTGVFDGLTLHGESTHLQNQ